MARLPQGFAQLSQVYHKVYQVYHKGYHRFITKYEQTHIHAMSYIYPSMLFIWL